jgi:hypothetical protein
MARRPKNADDNILATTRRKDQSAQDIEVGFITEQIGQLKKDFEPRNVVCGNIDTIMFMDHVVNVPKNYQKYALEVKSPLQLHAFNTITAALSANPPQVHHSIVGVGDDAKRNASERRRFFEASWIQQERESRRRLHRLFMSSIVTKGEGILKTVERKKRAWEALGAYGRSLQKELNGEDYDGISAKDKLRVYDGLTDEYKQGLAYPIATTDVPPETFYYVKNEDGFTCCAEIKKVPYYDAMTKYGLGFDSKGKLCPEATGLPRSEWGKFVDKDKCLQLIEYWDWQYVYYILEPPSTFTTDKRQGHGLVVKKIKHGYGNSQTRTLRGPYFHSFGITTASRQVQYQGLSVLFGYLYLFPLLDQLLTIQAQAAFTFGFPAYKRIKPTQYGLADTSVAHPFGADLEDQEADEEIIEPGTIYPYDLGPVDQPRTSVDLDKAISLTRQLIDLALPPTAQGLLQGDESGYLVNQAAHLASLAWSPIIDNAQVAHADRVGFESWLIKEKINERVFVRAFYDKQQRPKYTRSGKEDFGTGYLTIHPKDLGDNHTYDVLLEPEMPSNKPIELRSHEQMLRLGIETLPMAIEAMGYDPDLVEEGNLYEEIKRDPEIRARLKKNLFYKLELKETQQMLGVEAPKAAPGGGGGTVNMPLTINPGAAQGQGGPVQLAEVVPGAANNPNLAPPGRIPGNNPGVRNPPANARPMLGGPPILGG